MGRDQRGIGHRISPNLHRIWAIRGRYKEELMKAGGDFTIFGDTYEWDFDPIENVGAALEIVGDTYVQGVGGAMYDAYVASDDPAGNLVDNFTWPEQVVAKAIFGASNTACARGDEDQAQQTAMPANLKPEQQQQLDPTYSSRRDFNALWNRGINDYANKDLQTRTPNLTQQALTGWCTLMLDGKYFTDGTNWYETDDGTCDQWVLCNYDQQANPGLNRIFHASRITDYDDFDDECGHALDDDYDDIWFVGKRMEARWERSIPGITWWHPSVVDAWQYFDHTSNVLSHYPEVSDEFFKKFEGIDMEGGAGLVPEELPYIAEVTPDNNSTIAMLQTIFQRMAACGASVDFGNLVFKTKWRDIDLGGPENTPPASSGQDWVTPLIHAGALYFQMVAKYQKDIADVMAKLDANTWEIIEDDQGTLYIRQSNTIDPNTAQPRQIEVMEYMNDYIWQKPGEDHETIRTALIGSVDEQGRVTAWGEIGEAVERSLERCRRCSDEPIHIWAANLMRYIDIMRAGISLDVSPTIHVMDQLRQRARRSHGPTAEECCHMNPPRFLDETTSRCNTQMTAAEWCHTLRPPRFFEPESCACSTETGASICHNMQPPGTHVFVYDPATQTSRCEPCHEPTPMTDDGLTCVGRPVAPPPPPPRRTTARDCLNTPPRETRVLNSDGTGCVPCPPPQRTTTGAAGSCRAAPPPPPEVHADAGTGGRGFQVPWTAGQGGWDQQ